MALTWTDGDPDTSIAGLGTYDSRKAEATS